MSADATRNGAEHTAPEAGAFVAARRLLAPLCTGTQEDRAEPGSAPVDRRERGAGPLLERILGVSHHAGMLGQSVLEAVIALAPAGGFRLTLETGCGRSTLLLSQLSREHHVFALDDRAHPRSSVATILDSGFEGLDRVRFHFGPSQQALPRELEAALGGRTLDLALIDGPHGYPFPELEYWAIYPHLAPGALLVIDDIHIATIARLYEFLRQDEMFDLLHVEAYTAFFRRNDAPATPALGDHWWEQAFNVRLHPVEPASMPVLRPEQVVSHAQAWDGFERYLARGFAPLELGRGARSVRERAAVRFRFSAAHSRSETPAPACLLEWERHGLFSLELGVSVDPAHSGRQLELLLLTRDGYQRIGNAVLASGRQAVPVEIDPRRCYPAGVATIELRMPWVHAAAPERADFRQPGITLETLALWRTG